MVNVIAFHSNFSSLLFDRFFVLSPEEKALSGCQAFLFIGLFVQFIDETVAVKRIRNFVFLPFLDDLDIMAVANRETASVREGFLVTGAKDVQARIAFANGVFFRDFDISSSKQLVRMFAIKVSDLIIGSEFHDLDIEILKVLNQQLFPCITNKIHDGIVVASFTAIAFSARRIAAVFTKQMIVN